MSNHSKAPSGRHQRSVKNLLLDKKFQLKYTGYLVAIATILSVSLGLILWRTSAQVIRQGERSAAQGEQIVELGRVVVGESRKVSAVVRMNIVKDPIYQDDPDLLAAFNSDAKKQDELLEKQRLQLEQQRSALVEQAVSLQEFHRIMLISLAGILTLLVACIGAAGIFVTHKVAGPIFKMRRHLKEVTEGHLEVPWGLRKGDELVEFFDTFREMVGALRAEREAQIKRLQEIAQMAQGESPKVAEKLAEFEAELQRSLS